MHRCETGREGRALNTIVSNQPESAAKGAAFASARAAALRVMGADALRGWIGNTYLDGFDRISPAFLNSTGLM